MSNWGLLRLQQHRGMFSSTKQVVLAALGGAWDSLKAEWVPGPRALL
jgi:hypothetical protein